MWQSILNGLINVFKFEKRGPFKAWPSLINLIEDISDDVTTFKGDDVEYTR
mgnify:FL=1